MNTDNSEKHKHKIIFDLSSVAKQAHGVLAKCGGTTVLCTTVVGEKMHAGFIPLSVHYLEKFSAVNRLPGGFKKREGASSDGEIVITRAIDRSLRAIIPDPFSNEIQVTIQVLSYDGHSLEVLAIAAASLSINLANVTNKLVAASRITGHTTGNLTNKSVYKSSHIAANGYADLLQAICEDKIVMLEFMGNATEGTLLKSALSNSAAKIIKLQAEGAKIAKEILMQQKQALQNHGHVYDKKKYLRVSPPAVRMKMIQQASEYVEQYISACDLYDQVVRRKTMENAKNQFLSLFNQDDKKLEASHIFASEAEEKFAAKILKKGKRFDGRKFDAIRKISMNAGFVSPLHGSALFTRGDTQALVSVTVAPSTDAQSVESLNGLHKENFLLHYNFLPYAVAEIGKIGAVSRREVGHGELARKAFLPLLPKKMDCAVRVVSEITSSNGSSSMATVCGASLALFDAGVQLPCHVAGISIGLIEHVDKRKIKNVLLADITGCEDMLGKMDFKIAATKNEITAMQLDIKNEGITHKIMADAIELALKHIKKILTAMYKEIKQPRSTTHGVQEVIKVDPTKVRLVIGRSGSTVNSLTSEFRVKIDIDRSGKIVVTPNNNETTRQDLDNVIEKIKQIVK